MTRKVVGCLRAFAFVGLILSWAGSAFADEGDEPRNENVFGLKGNVMYTYSQGNDVPPAVGGAFFARLEKQHFFLDTALGAVLPTQFHEDVDLEYWGLYGDIGIGTYLLPKRLVLSPYVGVGISPRIFVVEPAIFTVYGQAGLSLPQTKSWRLFFEVRATQSLTEVEIWDPDGYEEDDEPTYNDSFPLDLTLSVGVGF